MSFGLCRERKLEPLTSSLELCVRLCVCRVIHKPVDGTHTHTGSHKMFPSKAVKMVPDKKRGEVRHAKMTWNEKGNGAAWLFCAWFRCNLSRSSLTFKRWFSDFTSRVPADGAEQKQEKVSQSGRKGFKRRGLWSVQCWEERESLKLNGSFDSSIDTEVMDFVPWLVLKAVLWRHSGLSPSHYSTDHFKQWKNTSGCLQVLDVHGSSEGFSRDGLDEVLTQISVKDNRRKWSHISRKKKKHILTVSHKRECISVLSNQ